MGHPAAGIVVGVEPSKAKNTPLKIVSRTVPIDVDAGQASQAMAQLVELARRCCCVALPVPVSVAAAWARRLGSVDNGYKTDLLDPATSFVFGDLAVDALAAYCAPDTSEPALQLARRLWRLLDGETT
jgi:hypothetical protein